VNRSLTPILGLVMMTTVLVTADAVSGVAAGTKSATHEDFRKAQDDYYASDLEAAITEARQRTHHYDYSSEFRYERTTSQSIRFSRMLNNELEAQRIKTASIGEGGAEIVPDDESGETSAPVIDVVSQNEKLTGQPLAAPIAAPDTSMTGGAGISVQISPR